MWLDQTIKNGRAAWQPSLPGPCSQDQLASGGGALLTTGDPRQAATIGNMALHEAAGIRSRRVVEDLRQLQRFAGRHPKVAEAKELHRRVGAAIEGAENTGF